MIKHIQANYAYTDLEPNLDKSWNNDIGIAKGIQAVKNSLVGILTTRQGSRPFFPEFGCNISDSLFENISILTIDILQQEIIRAITAFEPRVDSKSLRVDVEPLYDENAVNVTIAFTIISPREYYEKEQILKLRLGKDDDF